MQNFIDDEVTYRDNDERHHKKRARIADHRWADGTRNARTAAQRRHLHRDVIRQHVEAHKQQREGKRLNAQTQLADKETRRQHAQHRHNYRRTVIQTRTNNQKHIRIRCTAKENALAECNQSRMAKHHIDRRAKQHHNQHAGKNVCAARRQHRAEYGKNRQHRSADEQGLFIPFHSHHILQLRSRLPQSPSGLISSTITIRIEGSRL